MGPQMDRSSVDSKRYAIVADTYLQFPGEQVPLKARVGNLSQSGMFLVSEITYPAGTDFNFRITAERPEDTITGRGRVAWRRQVAAGQHRPPGMGCQILRLTDDSRHALERRLDASSQFEIMREPPDNRSLTQEFSRQSVQETLITQQISRPDYFQTASPSAGRRPTRLLPGILAAVAVLVAVGVGYWALSSGKLLDLDAPGAPVEAAAPPATQRPSAAGTTAQPTQPAGGQSASTSEVPPTVVRGGPSPVSETPSPDASEAPAPAPPAVVQPTGPTPEEALDTVRAWADAWSNQDPERYFSFYADRFSPGDGTSRAAWAAARRQRLTAPRFIRIDLEDPRFEGDSDRGVVTFRQSYRSDTFSDLVDKRLSLEAVDGSWQIVAEESSPTN